jgi:diadenosine tetraphosphate (Ap4A) HIT family hydrolase
MADMGDMAGDMAELPPGPRTWMPRERWDALVRGEGCPLCLELAADVRVNEYGTTVADLEVSRLRLAANQSVPGYCVLISARHVREPYELPLAESAAFWRDLLRAGQALETVFGALKLNFELLGNAVPHLHGHLKPRYYGDPAPERPIHPDARRVLLTPAEYEQRAKQIRTALAG